MISEWLKLMLEEIARKRDEEKRRREEQPARDAPNQQRAIERTDG